MESPDTRQKSSSASIVWQSASDESAIPHSSSCKESPIVLCSASAFASPKVEGAPLASQLSTH